MEPWNQSYHLSVSQQDPLRLATGLQDQDSIRTWTPGAEPTDLTQWNSYGGGDGHWVQINPDNELVYYACSQPSPPAENCTRFTDSGTTTTRTGTPASPATTIYAGTDTGKVWKTTNATAGVVTWTQLGAGVLPQQWVTSIAVDPSNANHVYVSFSNYQEGNLAANVWESTDGGTT